MPKSHLTHRSINSLTAGRWMTDYWDQGLPGFGVRAHPSGRKTFIVRYDFEGRKRRVTLGRFPVLGLADARDKARALLGSVAEGKDPQGEKNAERQAETFADLAQEYLDRHAKLKKRRWREDERVINVDLLPHWKERKAKDIRRRDVVELLDGIVERGSPIMANRIKALVSKIYNFGIGRDIVEHNPCLGVPMPSKENRRDRVLREEEIRALWRAFEERPPIMAATFKVRLLTAQRGIEVLTMRWEDIDGDWWTIPAETVKNGMAHRVPLSPQVQELLAELREMNGDSRCLSIGCKLDRITGLGWTPDRGPYRAP